MNTPKFDRKSVINQQARSGLPSPAAHSLHEKHTIEAGVRTVNIEATGNAILLRS
jgi:hypothetical protein